MHSIWYYATENKIEASQFYMNSKNDLISIRSLWTIKLKSSFPQIILHAFLPFFFMPFILCALNCSNICFFSAFPILIILQRPAEMLLILQLIFSYNFEHPTHLHSCTIYFILSKFCESHLSYQNIISTLAWRVYFLTLSPT